jgi:peptide/nickel transport system permease protein
LAALVYILWREVIEVILYIIKRILLVIPVLLGISIIIFTMLYFTPGDPVRIMLGPESTPEQMDQLRHEFGLDQPYWTRFSNYIRDIVTKADLGKSYTTRQSVSTELFTKFPYSVRLALWSAIIATVLGIIAGIISAIRQYTIFDNVFTLLGLVGLSMPNFWLGLLLIIAFAVNLPWFPSSGVVSWQGWILPSVTIGISNMARIMRMTRSSMLEVMRQDYITTARAKGLAEYVVILKHAFGNAFIPIITVIGLTFGGTMGGAIVTERVFSIPGIGKLMVDSIAQLNYPMVQGGVLLVAAWFCMINLAIDMVYAFIDPRIKAQYMKKKNKITIAKEADK